MIESHLELLRDKYVVWERASRQGPMDSRDYNARCAEALKAALSEISEGGEEFLEFKEALDDLRSLRAEAYALNGGGPNWVARNQAAWERVDALFADEDEAAYDRAHP